MQDIVELDLARAVRDLAHPLRGTPADYDPLLAMIGEAPFVLLGEASHGTHEFYAARAHITERLIAEKGFTAVAVEADWPDAYRVNRFVRCAGADADPNAALRDFRRFPQWMWRNAEVARFVGWMKAYNESLPAGAPRAGFYGLDLYSLHASMEAVLAYLDRVDPAAAERTRARYACFDHHGEDPQSYGFVTTIGGAPSCEEGVLAALRDVQAVALRGDAGGGCLAADEPFFAEQNARLVKNAETYYRAMFLRDVASWNVRDSHMAETLDALVAHLGRDGVPPKVVVWAHNSHLGDARATEMARRGEHNLGQLVRERHGRRAVLVGFTTDHGFVTAADDWGGPARHKAVRPALDGSWERLFHASGARRFLMPLRHDGPLPDALRTPRLERAIGVIYRPQTERTSHYFHADLVRQFDAVLHFDATRAVQPLDPVPGWSRPDVEDPDDLPETWPTGI